MVGVGRGQRIGSAYDPMVAKLIAYGDTREQARRRMLLGLRDTVLLGPSHNKRFLLELLRHAVFVHGQVTTGFVESEAGQALVAATPAPRPEVIALAAVLWLEARREPGHVRPGFPFAWHSAHQGSSTIELRDLDRPDKPGSPGSPGSPIMPIKVRLRPESDGDGRPTWRVEQSGAPAMSLTILSDDGLRVTFVHDGHRRVAHRAWTAEHQLQLELDAITHNFAEHRPHESSAASNDGGDGTVRAPTMGRVLALFVEPGTRVEPGQRLLTLEAMKIESTITAPIAGSISEVRVRVGDQVDKRQLLVTITPAEPT
jgi:geranyl-CoA carboxylase alpha subunit